MGVEASARLFKVVVVQQYNNNKKEEKGRKHQLNYSKRNSKTTPLT
jgi:hypothetical protein